MKLIVPETCQNNPWTELDRFFEHAFSLGEAEYPRSIPVSHYETEDAHVLEMELPGVEKKNISLSYEKGILSVQATRKVVRPDAENEFKLERSIRVGNEIDFKKADARLENGILTISLPRREQDKPLRINVS